MEYKLDGLVRDEQKLFRAMDADETGRYLPFSYLRGVPSPYQKDKRADSAKLDRIRLHLDDLVTRMGEQLYGGQIAAEPLVTGRSPCCGAIQLHLLPRERHRRAGTGCPGQAF